jgi:hypothetical protein
MGMPVTTPSKGEVNPVQRKRIHLPALLNKSSLEWRRYQSSDGLTTLTDTNGGVQNIVNLQAEKAVASFLHVPQMFKVTVIYALPFGNGEMVNLHGPLDWVLGGWKLTANGIYQSGDTLGITDSFASNGIFATTRPNYTGQPVELNQKGFIDAVHNTGPLYLNPAAFTHVPFTSNHKVALTTVKVPSILPGILGAGYAFENLGLQKGFGLGEGRKLASVLMPSTCSTVRVAAIRSLISITLTSVAS